jgi:hypothetical protein
MIIKYDHFFYILYKSFLNLLNDKILNFYIVVLIDNLKNQALQLLIIKLIN